MTLAEVARRGRAGYGIDDGAGLLFRGDRAAEAISARDGAAVWRVVPDGRGRAREVAMESATVVSSRPAIDEIAPEVRELRAVRALRAGRL